MLQLLKIRYDIGKMWRGGKLKIGSEICALKCFKIISEKIVYKYDPKKILVAVPSVQWVKKPFFSKKNAFCKICKIGFTFF